MPLGPEQLPFFTWFGFYAVGAKHNLLIKDQAEELKRVLSLGDGLNEIEAVLIQVLEPRLNRRGPNWQSAEEYLQAVSAINEDSEPEDTTE